MRLPRRPRQVLRKFTQVVWVVPKSRSTKLASLHALLCRVTWARPHVLTRLGKQSDDHLCACRTHAHEHVRARARASCLRVMSLLASLASRRRRDRHHLATGPSRKAQDSGITFRPLVFNPEWQTVQECMEEYKLSVFSFRFL